MTAPELRDWKGQYGDRLEDCDLLRAHGWTGHFVGVPSVTKINRIIEAGGGLDTWKRRTVAEYAMDNTEVWPTIEDAKPNADRWETMVKQYGTMAGWKGRGPKSVYARALAEYQLAYDAKDLDACHAWQRKLAVDLIAEAPNRHARLKAQDGELLHKALEDAAAGRTTPCLLPEEKAIVDQAHRWLDKWQPEFQHCEKSVFSRTHGYAGTPDAFVKLPGHGLVLADWKRKGADHDDVAYQLVAYQRADYLITGNAIMQHREGIPQVDGCVVVRFPPDGGDGIVRPVETTDRMFDRFLSRLEEHNDRNVKTLGDPIEPPSVMPGDPAKRAEIAGCIEILKAFYPAAATALAQRWPEGLPTLKKFDGHNANQLARIQQTLDAVEAEHQIPFGYADGSNSNINSNTNEKAAA
jgi:hypothetical protein